MARIDRWNSCPSFFLTCCGCMGPVVLFKFCLVVGPMLIMCLCTMLCIALFYLFTGFPRLIKALYKTPEFGPVVKFMLFLVLLIPTALFLPGVVIGAVFLSLYAAVALTMVSTNNEEYHVCGGYGWMFGELWSVAVDDFRRQCRDVLEDWTRPVGEVPGEMPCDIPLHELFLLIIAAVLGLSFICPMFQLIMAIKVIPFTMRAIYELGSAFKRNIRDTCPRIACCIPFLVVCCLVPVFVAIMWVAATFLSLVCALYTPATVFQSGRLSVAFRYMFAAVYQFDRQSYKIIFVGNGCCDEYNYNGKSFCDCCIDRVQCCAQDSDDGCLSSEANDFAKNWVRIDL